MASEVRATTQPTPAQLEAWKKYWDKGTSHLKIGSIGILILGGVLAFAGTALCFAVTPVTVPIGIVLIALSLPIFWHGYNCLMASRNMQAMSENSPELVKCSEEEIKQEVGKNTLFCGWIIDMAANKMKAEMASLSQNAAME